MKPRFLSSDFLQAIGDYMLVSTKLERADACIVFGGGVNSALLARHAVALYQRGLFDLAVVTGGVRVEHDGRTEAELMQGILLDAGMPKDRVLVENKAQNTGENVLFSKEILADRKINSVIGIGQIHASRRFLQTLEKHWPAVKKMFSTSNHFNVPREQWYLHPEFCEGVMREYWKTQQYRDMGFTAEVNIGPSRPRHFFHSAAHAQVDAHHPHRRHPEHGTCTSFRLYSMAI